MDCEIAKSLFDYQDGFLCGRNLLEPSKLERKSNQSVIVGM